VPETPVITNGPEAPGALNAVAVAELEGCLSASPALIALVVNVPGTVHSARLVDVNVGAGKGNVAGGLLAVRAI
jgi:hypothetical protein